MVTKTGSRSSRPATGLSVRDRLLTSADELFYSAGVQTVGVDRVIEHAGVAKASLYKAFGSKEELVRAYLESRHASTAARILSAINGYATARERLLGVFEAQEALFIEPGFRGCAFVSATAEARPGSTVEKAADEYRAWVLELFTGLAEEAGAADAPALALQLQLLYDGAALSARMDHDPASAAAAARAAAVAVLNSAGIAPTSETGSRETGGGLTTSAHPIPTVFLAPGGAISMQG
ncbi:TetR/AcrR family transcriptional regulator [Streptomyces mirabilis]|uniref:TetR/AcrR family transcriptional regulator n=1 Tax=Streptomyces mirabilis TaxID=68239 RepID=UPI0033B860D1